MGTGSDTEVRISDAFRVAAESNQSASVNQSDSPKKKPPAPFSLRLSAEERALLEQQAGGKPLGAYIRERLLGDQAAKRKIHRKPKIDEKQIAHALAELGRSRLSSNLNQLAKSANMGTLDVSRDIEQELQDACGAVLAMRDALITALGLKAGNGP